MRRALNIFALLLAVVVAACAIPIAFVELSCKSRTPPPAQPASLMAPSDRRALGDSYLTFPEWNIVYAYADLAGVMRQSSESSFDYLQSIAGFWSSLCDATRTASSLGPVTADQTITNYIIALSFTAEMAIKGFWERTIGAVAVATRGRERTPEDDFALTVADDYAAFLHQTPWYRFPFGKKLRALRSVPFTSAHLARSVERRIALSLEYGGKALYAKAMDALAGASPADLSIRTLVRANCDDLAAVPGVTIKANRGDGLCLIETARYEAFTNILRIFAKDGRDVVEIAGNRRLLTTVLAPASTPLDPAGASAIFSLPIQSKPGVQRIGYDTPVEALTRQIRQVEQQGATFEHAYDY